MRDRYLAVVAVSLAVLAGVFGCGDDDAEDEDPGWTLEELESQGAELIEERSGASVQLTCNEGLPNDSTYLVACRASDDQQYIFTATDAGELDVLVNEPTPTTAPEVDDSS